MHMGYNNEQAEYVMNNVKLECVTDEKDLIGSERKWRLEEWEAT